MKKRNFKWKKIICLFYTCIFFAAFIPTTVLADVYWPEEPEIDTPCATVIEANSGAVLYEKNADQVNYPASITKIMTTLLALEYCEMDEIVTFSDDAINLNQGDTSHIARDYGEQMTMEQCLYAVMLESANECSYAVAEHVGQKLGGDYRTFIDLMNEKAKSLGCTNTHFNNSSGLPDPEHFTSSHDMALIAAEAYQNEIFRSIVGCRSYRIPPTNKHADITPLNNHHAMISNYKTTKYLYEYCTGGKTGYTDAAGSTLVTFAEKDGLTLVCVVMNTTSPNQYLDTTTLFEYCFQNFQNFSLAENEVSGAVNNKNRGIMNNYDSYVEFDKDAYVVLPVTADFSDVKLSLMTDELTENVIAKMQYTYGDYVVGSGNIIPSGAEVGDNYFEWMEQRDAQSETNIVRIKPRTIAIAGGVFLVVVILLICGKMVYDNYYVIRHDLEVRNERKRRFRPSNQKKKKWRKRDRMFK